MIVAATSYCPHAFGLTYVGSNPAVYRTLCSQSRSSASICTAHLQPLELEPEMDQWGRSFSTRPAMKLHTLCKGV